jgi:hypothetical protein
MLIRKAFTETVFDLSWRVHSLLNDTAILRVTFRDPSQVSIFSEKDELVFKIDQDRYIRNLQELNETELYLFE